MPRGVAIPELHERLFAAAERLLLRDGPAGLSSRAITAEAACAKGVLHNHFSDLDGFLLQFVLTRFRNALDGMAELPLRAGQDTVWHNLSAAAAALFQPPVLAAHAIVTHRPTLAARLRQSSGHHSPSLADLEHLVVTYLDSEKRLRRLPPTVDTGPVALALVATIHHLVMSARTHGVDPHETFDRVVAAVVPAGPRRAAPSAQREGTAR
ncbi:TetR/AcrR family transcriptional regulator [Micromonospora sp. CPCC 206061]|uniref:TetR/AcrR family transcriptional regulator n=1 Tax=Micromonospora sp. CPCC 206061 TaxID=3122410 RepID=UPI002FF06EA6